MTPGYSRACGFVAALRQAVCRRSISGILALLTGLCIPAVAQTFGPGFGSYTLKQIYAHSDNPVSGAPHIPPSLGGLALHPKDASRLIVGGDVAGSGAAFYSVQVTRDTANHITSLTGRATRFASAPKLGGGAVFDPLNNDKPALLYSLYSASGGADIAIIRNGSVAADASFDVVPGTTGSVAFVPDGLPGKGQLKLLGYDGSFFSLVWSVAPNGTWSVSGAILEAKLPGAPGANVEGMAYVRAGSPGFPGNTLLVSETKAGNISAYDVDSKGNPIPSSRRLFLSGGSQLKAPEGLHVDTLTGDLLVSVAANSQSAIYRISGFAPPFAGTGTVSSNGGSVEVTNPGSSLYGTKIVLPAGALPQNVPSTLTIRELGTLPGPLPPNTQQASKIFVFDKSTPYNFRVPVTITIPLENAGIAGNDIPVVFYWSPTYGKYRPVSLVSIDRAGKTVTFQTSHFSIYVALLVPGISLIASQQTIDSGFRSDVDGFYHPNFGSYDDPGGSCLGMALYSAWYYSSKKALDGQGLYSKYLQGARDVWEDDAVARELISRAYIASSQTWASRWEQADRLLSPLDTALVLWSALWITGEPQILLFSGSGFGHAVTVSAWNATTKRFEIYDNNFRGETATLAWSPVFGFNNYSKAANYNTITNFAFEGLGVALEGPEFENFYAGAEAGWPISKFKQIEVTTPAPDLNGVITAESAQNVTVQGTVTGGIQAAGYIVPFLNGTALPVVPISAGTFSTALPSVPNVTNSLVLMATNDPNDNWNRLNAYAGFKEYPVRVQGRTFLINPGFETGDFTGWLHETHTWQNLTPGSFQPPKSAIATVGADPIDTALQSVNVGRNSARVNNSDNNFHISSVTQTAVVPSTGRPELRLYWAAVLEDPRHAPSDQPYVDVSVRDNTTGQVLYSRHFYSNDPSFSGWRSVRNGAWRTIPWQVITLPLQTAAGHSITVRVTAADCALGGHGGYAYVDGDVN